MTPSLFELWMSTVNLYSRFGLKPSVKNAENGILEECLEVLEQLVVEDGNGVNREHLADEVVDTMVVLISGMLARGLTLKELERAMLRVMNKNDAKSDKTHVVWNDKITRKEKVVLNYESSD